MNHIRGDNVSMNLAVIYCRKSTEDKERQILSLDDQLHEAKKILKSRSLKSVAPPFVEEKSGKESGVRVAFYEMLKLIESGAANTIICWKADRLARNGTDGGRLIELIDKGKLKIITAFSEYDRTNSIMLWVDFGFSTKYSKDLSDNVKRALKRKCEKGIRPGIAPLGYMNTPQKLKGEREIVPDPKRFDLMRKWWELMLMGVHTVESSMKVVVAKGLTDRNGRRPLVTVGYSVFRNIFYAGPFDYGGVRYQGVHKPMISLVEFVRVQKILDAKGNHGRSNDKLPFQGFIRCGECGGIITGEKHHRGHKMFYYYRCTKKKAKCSQPYLNAEEMNPQIKAYLSSMKLDPGFAGWIKGVLKRRNQQQFETAKKSKELISKNLINLDKRKEVVCKMRIDGLIDEKEYQKKIKEILNEESQLNQEMSNETSEHWTKVIEATINFAGKMTELFEKGDVPTKQMILKILGSNIVLKNKKLEITPKSAFLFLSQAQTGYFQEIGRLEQSKRANIGSKHEVSEYKNISVPRTVLYSNILDRLNSTRNETETLGLELQLLHNYNDRLLGGVTVDN